MQLIPYENINKEHFFSFLKKASLETSQPAYVNLWDDNWQNATHTLPYILEKTNRFNNGNGKFYILINGTDIAGCSGVYRSSFCNEVALAGTRSWISKSYRHRSLLKTHFFPTQKLWAIENGCKQIALTFNEYNKKLIEVFKRTRFTESSLRVKNRTPDNLFYNGVIELDFPVKIQYTKQWVAYESLDPKWDFNWETIKWQDHV